MTAFSDALGGDGMRWVVAAAYFLASVATFGSLWRKLRNGRAVKGPLISTNERIIHLGGGLICFLVSYGLVGFLLDWDAAARLPVLLLGALLIIFGRGREWVNETKAGRDD